MRLPGVRHLHERQLLFPVLVLLVVAGVLIHGALDQERAVRAERGGAEAVPGQASDTDPQEAAVPLRPPIGTRFSLRGDLEKTPLTYFSDYWAQLASEMGAHLLELGASGQSGLVIEPGLAVTSVVAADALTAVAARARLAAAAIAETAENGNGDTETETDTETDTETEAEMDMDTDAWAMASSGVRALNRAAGLALVEVDEALPPFVDGDPRALPSGSYIGTVTLDAAGVSSITPGYLASGSSDDDLAISLPPPRTGLAAVVDLDGLLIGVTYVAPDGPRTVPIDAFRRELDRMSEPELCRAISVADLDVGVLDLLGTRGLLIDRVVASAFLPEPSLRAGDVLIEWDGEPVTSVEGFAASYDAIGAGELVRYRVIRGRRRVAGGTVLPDAECRAEAPAVVRLVRLGFAVEWREETNTSAGDRMDPSGWIVTTVVPDGPAGRAGIAEGDRLLAVDGRAVAAGAGTPASAEIERLDTIETTLLLSLGRGDRVTLAALGPVEP